MLKVKYKHPLHGCQTIDCKELVNVENRLHAVNIHGVTFQTLNPKNIIVIESTQ